MGGNSGHEYTQYKNKLFHPLIFYTTYTMSDAAKIKELETRIKNLEHLVSTLTVQPTKKVKKTKDPDAPKRPPSAYNLFVREMKKQDPKTGMKELGRMWKQDYPDDSDRAEWNDEAAAAKKVYQAQLKAYAVASKMTDDEE